MFDLVVCWDRGLDKGLAILNIYTIENSANFVFPLFRFQFMASEGQETVSKSPACTLSALWCSVLCYRNPIAFPYYARPRFSWSKNCYIGRIKFSFELEDEILLNLLLLVFAPLHFKTITLWQCEFFSRWCINLTVSVYADLLLMCSICKDKGSLSQINRFSLSPHNAFWG